MATHEKELRALLETTTATLLNVLKRNGVNPEATLDLAVSMFYLGKEEEFYTEMFPVKGREAAFAPSSERVENHRIARYGVKVRPVVKSKPKDNTGKGDRFLDSLGV